MLLKLGRPRGALALYRQSLGVREEQLRPDSTNLFNRLQLLESRAGICRAVVALTPAAASRPCAAAATLMAETTIEPANAGYRGYLGGAFSDLAGVYDTLAASPAISAGAARRHRLAALDAYRRSEAIWSDLSARGLVNPVDTGRVTAARRALARAEALAR